MAITLNGTTGVTTTGLTSNGIDDNATSTAMTLDTSGNLLVGKTGTSLVAGHGLLTDGTLQARKNIATANSSSVGYISRGTTDGNILTFYKDTTSVGSIGVSGGNNLYITGNASSHAGVTFATQSILPTTEGAINNNTVDLGQNGNAFKDLYLSGGVYLGGTGAANKLDDYEEGTWTPSFPNGGTIGSVNSATYTKIGRIVWAGCYISTLSIPNDGNYFYVGGLPFVVSGSSTYQAAGGVGFVNGANWRGTGALNTPIAATNATHYYFHREDGNSSTLLNAGATVLSSQEFICTVVYQTDS